MKYISAQPASFYYAWQAEVMINNFLSMGIKGEDIHIVCSKIGPDVGIGWLRLQEAYPAKFFFYDDSRSDRAYQPGIQSHILEKHWKENPYLDNEVVFFHDVDFLFTRPFDFTPFLNDDIWYFSNTISYIGSTYIQSKGEEVLDSMCNSIGIDKQIVIDNESHSGGAQKLFKNITADYWNKVYDNQMKLWYAMGSVGHIKKEGDPYGIQRWTASMWAELWTGWMMGYQVRVPKEFNFCWATDAESVWNRLGFYHNAGVTGIESGLFYKGNYINKLPYNENLNIKETSASKHYWEWVKKTAETSVLI
jgi:hypothetical protein